MGRPRKPDNGHLDNYPGLGLYSDGRYFFKNPKTGRHRSLKTRDLKQAIARWAVAKALVDKAYGDDTSSRLASSLVQSNTPTSRGAHAHLADFIRQWRTEVLEQDKVKVKIKRNQGKPLSGRTKDDYIKLAKQLETSPESRFPLSHPQQLSRLRQLLSPWITKPTHYNHLKAVLGRVYDHAVYMGLVERNPMRDVDKQAVARREVLMPDEAYLAITEQLTEHRLNKQVWDGRWRAYICDLLYMLSQQPVDAFSLRLSQLRLEAGEHGEIHLARAKTNVTGIIGMNAEMREVVDWLLAFRREQLQMRSSVLRSIEDDHLLIYPAYMDRRSRWKPVTHRTFADWWRKATKAAGYDGQYWLMDLRKKGLTDEFVAQGENDKGLHETEAMRNHYRLIKPPKHSRNTLTRIQERQNLP